MGGYRARGALATVALATVVLVAVVVAGTVSMAPLGDNWTARIADGTDRDSFEIVGGVVVPGPPASPEPPTVLDPRDPRNNRSPDDVDVAGTLDPGDDTDPVVIIRPAPVPPGPIDQPPPDPGNEPEPEQPPVDPGTPTELPTEPVPTETPSPPDRVAGGPPWEGPGPVAKPRRPDGHEPKQPRPVAGRAPKVKRPEANLPIVIIIHPPRGPKWRPAPPARQKHPQHDGKWANARPHPRQRAKTSDDRKRRADAAPQKRRRPPAPAVHHQRPRPPAVVPPKPQVRRGGNGERGRGEVRHGPRRGHRGHGHGGGHGRGGKKGKRGRR